MTGRVGRRAWTRKQVKTLPSPRILDSEITRECSCISHASLGTLERPSFHPHFLHITDNKNRINLLLGGDDESDLLDHLSATEKKTILEILRETHPLFRDE